MWVLSFNHSLSMGGLFLSVEQPFWYEYLAYSRIKSRLINRITIEAGGLAWLIQESVIIDRHLAG
jgi:hypothetical protein